MTTPTPAQLSAATAAITKMAQAIIAEKVPGIFQGSAQSYLAEFAPQAASVAVTAALAVGD